MKIYVIQSKKGIVINVGVSVKWMELNGSVNEWNSCKKITRAFTCDFECDKSCKIGEYLDIKNYAWKKYPFGKLLLACEADIVNMTRTT